MGAESEIGLVGLAVMGQVRKSLCDAQAVAKSCGPD